MILRAHIDVRLGRGLNDREHPLQTHRRAKLEQALAQWALVAAVRGNKPELPLKVTMTRSSPSSKGLDDDNLVGSLKHVRDGIAQYFGVNDADPRVQWVCWQCSGPWGCEIVIEEIEERADGRSRPP